LRPGCGQFLRTPRQVPNLVDIHNKDVFISLQLAQLRSAADPFKVLQDYKSLLYTLSWRWEGLGSIVGDRFLFNSGVEQGGCTLIRGVSFMDAETQIDSYKEFSPTSRLPQVTFGVVNRHPDWPFMIIACSDSTPKYRFLLYNVTKNELVSADFPPSMVGQREKGYCFFERYFFFENGSGGTSVYEMLPQTNKKVPWKFHHVSTINFVGPVVDVNQHFVVMKKELAIPPDTKPSPDPQVAIFYLRSGVLIRAIKDPMLDRFPIVAVHGRIAYGYEGYSGPTMVFDLLDPTGLKPLLSISEPCVINFNDLDHWLVTHQGSASHLDFTKTNPSDAAQYLLCTAPKLSEKG
jgi:hypothetical protein